MKRIVPCDPAEAPTTESNAQGKRQKPRRIKGPSQAKQDEQEKEAKSFVDITIRSWAVDNRRAYATHTGKPMPADVQKFDVYGAILPFAAFCAFGPFGTSRSVHDGGIDMHQPGLQIDEDCAVFTEDEESEDEKEDEEQHESGDESEDESEDDEEQDEFEDGLCGMMDPDQQEARAAHNKCMVDIQYGRRSCGRGDGCHTTFPKERMHAIIQRLSDLGKTRHLVELVTSEEHFKLIEALIKKLELKWNAPCVLHLVLKLTNEEEITIADSTDDTKSDKFWHAVDKYGIITMSHAFVTCGEDPRPSVFYNPRDGCAMTFCYLCADPYFHAASKLNGRTLADTREFAEALVDLNSPDNPYKCDECETWLAEDTVSCANCLKDFMPVATELNAAKEVHILIAAKEEAMRKKAEEALRKKSKKKGLPIEKEAAATLDNTAARAQLSNAMLKRTGELNDAVKFHSCTKCTHAKAEADAAAAAKVKAEADAAA
jgi:hypothetical protein